MGVRWDFKEGRGLGFNSELLLLAEMVPVGRDIFLLATLRGWYVKGSMSSSSSMVELASLKIFQTGISSLAKLTTGINQA